uniref:SH2 domain-containing protein n=1 Tax=Panagrellus redivivus TaxID=6233 RepID=A0A7E4UMM6_PANRE
MTERRINGDRFTGFRGHSAAPSTSPSQGGANVNPNSNRRAVAQVLPTSSGEDNSRKPHRHQTRNGVSSTPTLRRLEDCVPAEYTSSPIVQSLKAAEERPPPPRTLDDLSRSLAAMSTSTSIPTTQSRRSAPTHGMSVSCFQGISPGSISGSSGVSSAGSPSASDTPSHGPPNVRVHEVPARRSNNRPNGAIPRMGISSSISLQSSSNQALSMLERLVRSHPIWFLPHLGRAACNHLLRGLPAGCFIVRASTRPASMALSLRLPLSNHPDCADTDHFLLERIGATVRIEGSPRSFRSLPMLLEHYCKHADDLPCTLTLPMAIMSITSATELQKLALMGQDFWTSDYIRQPLDSRTRLYQSRRQVSQPVISMTKSMATSTNSNSSSNFADKSKRHRSPGSNGAPYTSSLSDQIQAATAMRPMSTSVMAGMGGSLSGSSSASGSIKARQRKALPTASSMLKKSRSEADEFKGKESLSSGTGSVSSKSSSRSTGGSGFLRQIFSSNAQPSTSTNNVANSRFYHATDIDNTHRYAMIGYTPPAPPNSSTGSSLRRSFAKLRGFKSRSKSKESKDDMGCNKLSADAIRARQDAYRRQKTDISFSSVQRLVSHRGSEHSPTRKIYTVSESKLKIIENERQPQMPVPILPKKAAMDSGAMAKCIEELRQKRMAQHGSMSPLPVATAGGKPSEESSTGLNDFEGFIQNNGKPYEVILRNKRSTNPRKGSDRMSVPNLTESQPQSTSTNADTSGYAKFGRSPDTGELQTINEGLITPVVRRKPLPPAPSKDDYTSAEYFAYGARSGGDKRSV